MHGSPETQQHISTLDICAKSFSFMDSVERKFLSRIEERWVLHQAYL